jgi:hypothetical protein
MIILFLIFLCLSARGSLATVGDHVTSKGLSRRRLRPCQEALKQFLQFI